MDDRKQRDLENRIDDLERAVKKLTERLDRIDPDGREEPKEKTGGFWSY